MTLPEFRCLICEKVFAEGADPSQPRETCAQCGKATLTNPTETATVELLPLAEVVPLARVVDMDIPTVTPVKPPPIPDVFPRTKPVAPVVPTVPRKQTEMFRPADVADPELPKPKLAFALFITFLTVLAIVASMTVVGYTIVLGLKKAAKRVEVAPTVRVSQVLKAER